jgi:hypothetical protein
MGDSRRLRNSHQSGIAYLRRFPTRRTLEAAGLYCASRLQCLGMETRRMFKLRKYLCWVFAFSCLVCLGIALRRVSYILQQHYAFLPLIYLKAPALFSIQATIFGVAWWAVWKEKPFATVLGIAASLILIGVPLWGIVFFSRSLWGNEGIVLVIGVAGLIAFLWPNKKSHSGRSGLDGGG